MHRMSLALSCFVLCASACGPEFAVVPRGGIDRAVAQGQGPAAGVVMVAFDNQWDAFPYDLADYVTPIAVELYNPGPSEVRVSYVDLALRDGSGFRYAAVNPYIPATAYSEADGPILPQPERPVMLASNGPLMLASNFGSHGFSSMHMGSGPRMAAPRVVAPPPTGVRGGGAPMGPALRVAPPPGGRNGGLIVGAPGARRPGYGWGYGGGGWNGYLVVGGLRPYYGFGVGYWGGPWIYPPYYRDWVYFWGPSYYPARPSMEVLQLGLPEGVLPPGARVSGFLYFKRATSAHQGALDLSWDVHDARSGASLGSLHVPLEVVHR